MLKENYKGTGSMVDLADQLNQIARALNNIQINMPRNYAGAPATGRVQNGRLIIDFSDCDFSSVRA